MGIARRRRGVALIAITAGIGALSLGAQAGARGGQLPPDPGGQESPDQPVPAGAKLFGFNSNLTIAGVKPSLEARWAKTAGASLLRVTWPWRISQPTPGDRPIPGGARRGTAPASSWVAAQDRLYEQLRKRGIRPIYVIYDAPVWASRYRKCTSKCTVPAGPLFPAPQAYPALERLVQVLADRYPAAIIEAWNEPNLHWPHQETAPTPEDMAGAQCAIFNGAARLAKHRHTVLSAGFGPFGFHRTQEYLRRFYASAGSCFDHLSVHAYNGPWNGFGRRSLLALELDTYRDAMAVAGDSRPMWITEFGYTTSPPNPTGSPSRKSRAVNQAQQLDLARRQYNVLVTMPDVGAVIAHTLRDASERSGPASNPATTAYGFGWITADGTFKPVLCHFARQAGNHSCSLAR